MADRRSLNVMSSIINAATTAAHEEDQDFETLLSRTRRSFRPYSAPNTTLRNRRRGRQRKPNWKTKFFALRRNNPDFFPPPAEAKYLQECGFGYPEPRTSEIPRDWSIAEVEQHVQSLYPQLPLDLVGFRLARCDKQRKLILLDVSTVKQLEVEAGHGMVIIIPNRDLPTLRLETNTTASCSSTHSMTAFATEMAPTIVNVSSPGSSSPIHIPHTCEPVANSSIMPSPLIADIMPRFCERCSRSLFGIRHCIVCTQDSEYCVSLERDRVRSAECEMTANEAAKTTARLERYAMVRENNKNLVEDEPTEGNIITLQFVHANGRTRRAFSATAPLHDIFHYIGSLEESTPCFELVDHITGVHLKNCSSEEGLISDTSLQNRSTIHVAWLDDEVTADESENCSVVPNTELTPEFHSFSTASAADSAASSPLIVYDSDSDEDSDAILQINRANIVAQLIQLYEHQTPEIQRVIFVGEKGYDRDGLKKDLFCSFWNEIQYRFFVGEREYIPFISPKHPPTIFTILGRILGHGYLLIQYLPPYLARSVYATLTGGKLDDNAILSSFVNVLSVAEQTTVRAMLMEDAEFNTDNDMYQRLVQLFSRLGNNTLPNKNCLKQQLLEMGRCELLQRPFMATYEMKLGFDSLGIAGLNSHHLSDILASMEATPERFIKAVVAHPADQQCQIAVDHFTNYVLSSDEITLKRLVRFITGMDVIVGDINIEFNGMVGEERHLSANTCSNTAHLPKTYATYYELRDELNLLLNSRYVWVFDST